LILEEFRSPATSSSFSSPDRSQHCSLFRLPLHKSVPSALAAPVGTTNFQSVLLATQHSPLATNSFAIRTSEKPALNSFRMRTSKTQHLKPFRMNTSKKPGEGSPRPDNMPTHHSPQPLERPFRSAHQLKFGAGNEKPASCLFQRIKGHALTEGRAGRIKCPRIKC